MSQSVTRLFIRIVATQFKSVVNQNNTRVAHVRCYCSTKRAKMDTLSMDMMCRQLAPPLTGSKYKGQAGRIAVFGGSLEYTGAPYFSAISALKVGADLVHVFCPKDAGLVIKTYSPELIVHPLLDDKEAVNKITPWLDRFHVIIIGPGLGREDETFRTIGQILDICKEKLKPIIIDADGLFYIAKNKDKLNSYPSPGAVLTPNAMEYARILGFESPSHINEDNVKDLFKNWGDHVTVLVKGEQDRIIDKSREMKVLPGGSGRRCGGQGDLLGGALATFFTWALQHKMDADVPHDDRPFLACYAACKLTKECNAKAFKKHGRSMVVTDMIEEIHTVFEELFEQK